MYIGINSFQSFFELGYKYSHIQNMDMNNRFTIIARNNCTICSLPDIGELD